MSTELRDDELLAIATPPHSKITLQIAAQQKADAQNTRARLGAVPAIVEQPQVPAAASETLPAAGPDYRARYLDAIAPTGAVVGRLIKFDVKSASFITIDDDAKVDPARDFVLLADQTLIGWIKFRGEGEAPDRRQGLLYDGFVVPPRHELGDVEPTQWDDGLDGRPQDPWKHQITIVLQDRSNGELFTFLRRARPGAAPSASCCGTTIGCGSRMPMVTLSCA